VPYSAIFREALIAITLTLTLRWLWRTSASSKAQVESASYVFPPTRAVRFLLILFGALFATFVIISLHFIDTRGGLIAACFFLGFLLLVILSFPPVLRIEVDGVSSRSWYGREKKLRWEDIASLHYNLGNKYFTVRTAGGGKITHSGFNADARFFRNEVQRRTHLPIQVRQPGLGTVETIEVGVDETDSPESCP
jgi:Bacterial PH domain